MSWERGVSCVVNLQKPRHTLHNAHAFESGLWCGFSRKQTGRWAREGGGSIYMYMYIRRGREGQVAKEREEARESEKDKLSIDLPSLTRSNFYITFLILYVANLQLIPLLLKAQISAVNQL